MLEPYVYASRLAVTVIHFTHSFKQALPCYPHLDERVPVTDGHELSKRSRFNGGYDGFLVFELGGLKNADKHISSILYEHLTQQSIKVSYEYIILTILTDLRVKFR